MPEVRNTVAALVARGASGAKADIDAINIADYRAAQQSCSAQPRSVGPFAQVAQVLLRVGLIPIPLIAEGDGKSPLVNGFTRWQRPPAPSTVAKWAERWPQSNIGIATGCGVVVVDLDSDDAALVEEVNRRFGPTPLVIATPSNGRHLFYRSSGERCANLRPELPVDIKGVGGYVVAPPSIRPSGEFAGRRYDFLSGSWADICRLPALRPGSLLLSNNESGEQALSLRAVRKGRRNASLFRSLLRAARHCDELDALLDVAHTIAADQFVYDPHDPFGQPEIEKTARSAWKYETEGRNWAGRAARIEVPAEEIATFISHGHGADMALLFLVLCRANWDRRQFCASPKAMALHDVIPAWGHSDRRYRRALKALVETGLLRIEKQGGSKRGDASIYSFSPEVGQRGAGGGGV